MRRVGGVVALTYRSAVDDPARFTSSKKVGPWVGMTPSRTHVVDVAGDVVTELASDDTDTVLPAVTYTFAADVENLTLAVAGRVGTCTVRANVLTGTSGSDTPNGGLEADTLIGGAGADLLVVDINGDMVVEPSGVGNDTVRSSIDHMPGAEVENLIVTGPAPAMRWPMR